MFCIVLLIFYCSKAKDIHSFVRQPSVDIIITVHDDKFICCVTAGGIMSGV